MICSGLVGICYSCIALVVDQAVVVKAVHAGMAGPALLCSILFMNVVHGISTCGWGYSISLSVSIVSTCRSICKASDLCRTGMSMYALMNSL